MRNRNGEEEMQFSIIIPVYNVEKFLRKCLDAIVEQKFSDYEVILIDDGSQDKSGEICDVYAEKYEKITVYHIENHGVSHARNIGLQMAKGKYIWFIDSDDFIESNALYNICEELKKKQEPDLLVFDANVRDQENNIKQVITCDELRKQNMNFQNDRELIYMNTALWNKIYKRQIISEKQLIFSENITIAEDLLFNYIYILECRNVEYEKKVLYNYIQRKNSAMQGAGRNRDVLKAFEQLIEYYKKVNMYSNYKVEIQYLIYYHIYLTSMIRMVRNNAEKMEINYILKWLKEQKLSPLILNKYVRHMPIKHIVLLLLIKIKAYQIIRYLFN